MMFILSILLSVSLCQAKVRCGRDFNDKLETVVKAYNDAYLAAGFKITEKKVDANGVLLRATYEVANSRYQQELKNDFYKSSHGVSYCGTIQSVREPKEAVTEERNSYIRKFDAAHRKASEEIEKKFPQTK